MKVLLPIFIAVFVLLLTACSEGSQSSSSSPALTETPTLTAVSATAPTRQPTTKSTVAPGKLTATYRTPRLGGPVSDFIGRYGQPDTSCALCTGGSYNFQRIQGTQTDYISGMLTDANGHVSSILVQSPNTDWDVATATALCESFGPSDVNYDHPLKVMVNALRSGRIWPANVEHCPQS